jgi:hypothetical protein
MIYESGIVDPGPSGAGGRIPAMPESSKKDEPRARPPQTPKPCCGAVGKGVHLPGCPKRVRELADSGAFDD